MPMIKAFRMDGLGNKFIIIDRIKDFVNITKEKIPRKNYLPFVPEVG